MAQLRLFKEKIFTEHLKSAIENIGWQGSLCPQGAQGLASVEDKLTSHEDRVLSARWKQYVIRQWGGGGAETKSSLGSGTRTALPKRGQR